MAAAFAITCCAGCGTSTQSSAQPEVVQLTADKVAAHPSKVLVVIEENHSLAEMQAQMPYLNKLSKKYAYAKNWHALTHPSLPNYLGIAGGSMFGVTDDGFPATNGVKVGSARSVFGQALAAGKTAATFADSMPGRCATTNSGNYAARHNPWVYFGTEAADCRAHDRSTKSFAKRARANRLPNVGFLIPNLIHDAHNSTLSAADRWLKPKLAPVLASKDFTSGKLVVVVTADEDDRHAGNVVLTTVLSARVHHKVVGKRLDHYSLTRYIAQVLGVRPLKNGRTAPNMKAAFGL